MMRRCGTSGGGGGGGSKTIRSQGRVWSYMRSGLMKYIFSQLEPPRMQENASTKHDRGRAYYTRRWQKSRQKEIEIDRNDFEEVNVDGTSYLFGGVNSGANGGVKEKR